MKIMLDKKEKIRGWINVQIVKLRRVSMVGSLFLMVLTNSLIIASFYEHRVSPFILIPVIFVAMGLSIWFLAHIYISKLQMYRTEKLAEKVYDPYAIYAMLPYEEMWFRHVYIPLIDSVMELLPEGKKKENLKKHLGMINEWVDKGIIPKNHFPEHLKKYYLTDYEHRLEL